MLSGKSFSDTSHRIITGFLIPVNPADKVEKEILSKYVTLCVPLYVITSYSELSNPSSSSKTE